MLFSIFADDGGFEVIVEEETLPDILASSSCLKSASSGNLNSDSLGAAEESELCPTGDGKVRIESF